MRSSPPPPLSPPLYTLLPSNYMCTEEGAVAGLPFHPASPFVSSKVVVGVGCM